MARLEDLVEGQVRLVSARDWDAKVDKLRNEFDQKIKSLEKQLTSNSLPLSPFRDNDTRISILEPVSGLTKQQNSTLPL